MSWPLTLPHKIMVAFLGVVLVFGLGFMRGLDYGREATLKAAVAAYQQRERINHDVQDMDATALCMALGGLRGQCAALMRGLDKTTQN